MNTANKTVDGATSLQAEQFMARLRAATERREGAERRFVTTLKRQHAHHLAAEDAIQLAKNMDVILSTRKEKIGRRLGVLCEKAFGATSSKELYRLRLADGEDSNHKRLRRSFGPYRVLAKEVAKMTGEPETKVHRELVKGTRFDELQAKVAEWDRVDAVADLLQDLIERLNEEFGWSGLYRRTVDVRLASGGKLTWPLTPNDYHAPSKYAEAGEHESFERKLQASIDPARMFYSGLSEFSGSNNERRYFDNDHLQDESFFFVPHARVGYVIAWDLPKQSEDPLGYQVARAKNIAWERKEPDGMNEPEIGWDAERLEPRGHIDAGTDIYRESKTQSYVWLIAYPSPLDHGEIVPALYMPGYEGGAWLMPLDRFTLAAIEDGIWLDRESDSTLIERLEVLLGADQAEGMCPLERDLRQTGSWLAHNPVLAWDAQQTKRRQNMLNRARNVKR